MEDRLDVASEFWTDLLRHSPLGILTDVDGTLVPFKGKADEVDTTPELRALVEEVASLPNVTLAVVSGRPREELERLFPEPRNALLVAEHGAWRMGSNGWEATLSVDTHTIDSLVAELETLGAQYQKARIERKTWSAAIHFRRLAAEEKADLLIRVSAILDPWLRDHPHFERLWGSEVLEIRPRGATKATAVTWMRERLGPGGRIVVAGDDVTDEDMFVAASEVDAAILVGSGPARPTAARWRLSSVEEVRGFLEEIVVVRRDGTARPSVRPNSLARSEPQTPRTDSKLLIISNRLPEVAVEHDANARTRNVGGLVSALLPVLEAQSGVWLGWSGKTHSGVGATEVAVEGVEALKLASLDFPEDWHRHYYNGFANSALWPLFHSFPARLRLSHDDWRSYVLVNDAFASAAAQLVAKDATIWVHDYHLLLVAHYLRGRRHEGKIGQFLHIPFPGPDVFYLLPWANELLDSMFDFDLLGFHTRTYADNFLHCAAHRPGVRIENSCIIRGDRQTQVGVFPLGITPEDLQSSDAGPESEVIGIKRSLGESRVVLGVDRLDYTKGIPERIEAFGRLLEIYPEWRRRVCLVQVSVPSRTDIGEYAEQRARIENSVGRINGEFGEADWVPIRYLYRSYAKNELAELYRDADVGYVTPLRDGMNLVAKEFVAAQDAANPGVLVLSRFAGAAEELTEAVLTNPWDVEGAVHDLDLALRMPLEERQRRHAALYEVVSSYTAVTWSNDFLKALVDGLEAHQSMPGSHDTRVDSEEGRSSGLWAYPVSGVATVGRGGGS